MNSTCEAETRSSRQLAPYPVYKDSGEEWLGSVPEHWEILPNRAVYEEVIERDHPEEMMLSVTIKRGVIQQRTLLADGNKKDSSNLDKSTYKFVRPGDLVYNKMRAWQGAIGVSSHQGIVSPAYIVECPRDDIHSGYIHYLLRTPSFAAEAERWSYGITSDMWSLRPEHFKMIYGCVPPVDEQAAIVRFLDHVDRPIRRYIRAKERLIELLEEQKQAIIHRAVTGQIDVRTGQRYPAYKDSSVERLGKVPAHWDIQRLCQCASIVGGMTPSMENQAYWNGSIPWVTPKDMKLNAVGSSAIKVTLDALKETSLRLINTGAVLIVVRGMILARTVPIAWTSCPVTVNQDMKALRPFSGINAKYLARALASAQDSLLSFVDVAGHGTRRLPTDRWRALPLAIPATDEQVAIVSYLDRIGAKCEIWKNSTKREIELLREYRIRLISDVVTGKLDVRDAAVAMPDDFGAPTNPTEAIEIEKVTERRAEMAL